MHNPASGTTQTAYGPVLCGYLAQGNPDTAISNADNYLWFATAMYLSAYDWSRVENGKRISTRNTRRSVLVEDNDWSWRTFLRGKRVEDTGDMESEENDDVRILWDD